MTIDWLAIFIYSLTTFAYHHLFSDHPALSHNADRSMTVPNVGSLAGLSWRVRDCKVSLRYRADIFFNAIDGGIDARKSENRGFFGPYASISIGLGD